MIGFSEESMLFDEYVPPQQKPKRPPTIEELKIVPARVQAALKFVDTCNDYSGLRGFPTGYGAIDFREQELHPAQEDAFILACNLIGAYFSGKISFKELGGGDR
jgi:hypothetical protein